MRIVTTNPRAYIYYLCPPADRIQYVADDFLNKRIRMVSFADNGQMVQFITEDGMTGITYINWLRNKSEIDKLNQDEIISFSNYNNTIFL